jgi:hypothetical protein
MSRQFVVCAVLFVAVLAGSAFAPGRHDPAAGDGGGTIAEQLTRLCGATWMIRGYDEATGSWSDWPAIRPSDAGRALEQTPGC